MELVPAGVERPGRSRAVNAPGRLAAMGRNDHALPAGRGDRVVCCDPGGRDRQPALAIAWGADTGTTCRSERCGGHVPGHWAVDRRNGCRRNAGPGTPAATRTTLARTARLRAALCGTRGSDRRCRSPVGHDGALYSRQRRRGDTAAGIRGRLAADIRSRRRCREYPGYARGTRRALDLCHARTPPGFTCWCNPGC